MEENYDIAIIGSGPAGLEAAITAKVRNKNIIVFGSADLSAKMNKVDHPIMNYLGMPKVTGKEMAAVFRRQIEDLGIAITEKKVISVFAMGDYFTLQLSDNSMINASAVILAAGVTAGSPYPGEEKFLGRGVSYCATCDAPLYKGKNVAVIGGSAEEEKEASFLAEVVNHVDYFPLYKGEVSFPDNVTVHHEKPLEIIGGMKAEQLKTEENTYAEDCIFVLREAQFPGQLVPGLDTEGNAVKVDLQMRTNLPGLFAAGDITGQPYQYIKAAGQGNTAALSAVNYLAGQKQK